MKNRIKFASTTTCYGTEDGRVTEAEKKWLEERARGDVGLVTTGIAHVTSWGRLNPRMLGGWNDSFIEDFRELSSSIHSGGAKACLSIGHCGRYAHQKEELADASSVPTRIMTHAEPRQLTANEIAQLAKGFGDTARRAREAGFDAVEVCGCAGYLLSSFLSPWTNLRKDRYGGSLENRARFSLEVIEAIKAVAGKDFPLIFRMCADELMPEGNSPEDLRNVGKMFEEAGADALSLTVGWHESRIPAISPEISRGHWLYLAEGMKKEVRIPVMMAYRVSVTEAEQGIQEGIIDLWEASRPFIADPEIPKKLAEGRPEDIVPCICCCQGCYDSVFRGLPIWCVVNPRAGKENDPEYTIKPAVQEKNVVVIGGGPAGMEAAIVSAMRGHNVNLLEKGAQLGGNLLTASIPPFKEEFVGLTRYFTDQLKKMGIAVKLNYEVDPMSQEVREADAVILANGALPLIPEIPGVERENVVTALDVLMEKKSVGDTVVIVGGGLVGCETAEFLSKKGKHVTVLEMLDKMAGDMGPTLRWRLLFRLGKMGVSLENGVQVVRINEDGVEAVCKGQQKLFPADNVVLAVGMESDDGLVQELKSRGAMFYQVGDAVKARKLTEAIQEAYVVATRL
ncbi:putative NADH oxidase [delta proteobacterium NaphS2]|nr:putative NADH oxidase [delta proteobacterium NaphS2]